MDDREVFPAFADLLKTYLPAGEALPEIPAALPGLKFLSSFTKIAPLFSNLPEAKQTVDIQPMEQFNQGWGTILYRTTLPEAVKSGTTLKITEVHDWAQIYADGKLLTRFGIVVKVSSRRCCLL